MLLTHLNKTALENYLQTANKTPYVKRDLTSIGFDNTFGIEIELITNDYTDFDQLHKIPFYFYEDLGWIPYEYEESINHAGAREYASPIYNPTKQAFEQIDKIYEILNTSDVDIYDNCSLHLNIGSQIFEENEQYFNNFLFNYLNFEDVLYEFGMIDEINESGFSKLANQKNKHSKIIDKVLFENLQYDYNFENAYYNISKEQMIESKKSFMRFRRMMNTKPDYMEHRFLYGTLDPLILNNMLNTMFKFYEFSKKRQNLNAAQEDYLYNLNDVFNDAKDKRSQTTDFNIIKNDPLHDTILLADLIFKDDLDKTLFLKQALHLHDKPESHVKQLIKRRG